MTCPDCGEDYVRHPDTDEIYGCACEHAEPSTPTPDQADAFLRSLSTPGVPMPPRTLLDRADVTLTDLLLVLMALAGLWVLVAEAAAVGL